MQDGEGTTESMSCVVQAGAMLFPPCALSLSEHLLLYVLLPQDLALS